MTVTSPRVQIPSSLFGTIHRPQVEVEFRAKNKEVWLHVPMIVDTGADYTILPKWLAGDLGINLQVDCEQHTTAGIGGSEIVFLYRHMTVRLGRWVGEIPVGFLRNNAVPPLLGRQDFSERFRLIVANYTTTCATPRSSKNHVR